MLQFTQNIKRNAESKMNQSFKTYVLVKNFMPFIKKSSMLSHCSMIFFIQLALKFHLSPTKCFPKFHTSFKAKSPKLVKQEGLYSNLFKKKKNDQKSYWFVYQKA